MLPSSRVLILLYNIIILSFFGACHRNKEKNSPIHTSSQAPAYPIKLNSGYTVNPISGDSVGVLVNHKGDTLVSAQAVTALGRLIHTDSMAPPRLLRVTPYKRAAKPQYKLLGKPKQQIAKPSLAQADRISFHLVNTYGDTIPTGEKIKVLGKRVSYQEPQPHLAQSTRYKEQASKNIQYLDVEQGFISSYVYDIIEDKQGNIWAATFNGLCKYDGTYFSDYTLKQGIRLIYVVDIEEDQQGKLWVATQRDGLFQYNGKHFTSFTEAEGMPSDKYTTIYEDSKGRLWFGTWKGLSTYNGNTFTHYTTQEGLSHNHVQAIAEDADGKIWFGTQGGGLNCYDGDSFTHYQVAGGLLDNTVWAICPDHLGNLWIATDKGVNCFDGTHFTHYTDAEGLFGKQVHEIYQDKQNNLWFGSHEGGLAKFDGKTFIHYGLEEGLSNEIIQAIYQDTGGNMWFGTEGAGINKLGVNAFSYLTEQEGLSNETVYDFWEDRKGHYWFATYGGGISHYDGNTFTYLKQENGFVDDYVLAILEDRSGNIWMGTREAGIVKFDGQTYQHYTPDQGLSDHTVYAIYEDRSGNLWFGTRNGGICKYDGSTFTQFAHEAGLPSSSVWAIQEDQFGNLWFGTGGGGLIKYDGESFFMYTEKEGLPANIIYSVVEDKRGGLWLGTYGRGLCYFDGQSVVSFTEKQGLSNNIVWSIQLDSLHNLWVSTEKGLTYLQIPKPPSKGGPEQPWPQRLSQAKLYSYFLEDGVKGLDFLENSVLLDRNNQIWWGSGKGVICLDLNSFRPSEIVPQVSLNQIALAGRYLDYRHLPDSIKDRLSYREIPDFSNYPLGLTLPYFLNHLTFNFSGLEWQAPHKLEYSHKMQGTPETWSSPSSEPSADYRNLPAGNYTFKLRARGSSQVWSDELSYSFSIRPPWWFSTLAILGYILLGLLLISMYVSNRTKIYQRREIILEAKVEERTREVIVQKQELEALNEELDDSHKKEQLLNEELRAANEQLIDQKEELEIALKKLQETQSIMIQSEKMASVGILTAGISHEINNPLNFINGGKLAIEAYLQGKDPQLSQDLLPLLEVIDTGIHRATQIVDSLNRFNRKTASYHETCDIHRIIENCLTMLGNQLKNKVEVHKYFSAQDLILWGNEGELHQVLLNVLSNSIQAIPEKGNISIYTQAELQEILIRIQDNGIGISPENLKKVTDPFFTTKAPGEGTGLGLSIAHSIIQQHQGSIEYESEVGSGTSVSIRLPLNLKNS